MPYSLVQLAPGAYGLLLNNVVMESVVRNGLASPIPGQRNYSEIRRRVRARRRSRKLNTASPAWSSYVSGSATPS